MPFTQANRIAAIFTPLADDKLCLLSMTHQEQLGRLPVIETELISDSPDIAPNALLGKDAAIELRGAGGNGKEGKRFFHGYFQRFARVGEELDYFTYQATIVPWFWFLTRTANCRIFQKMTVPDIIKQIFRERGFSDFDPAGLTRAYTPWEYCVQYRETDFNFISRLMEQEGIYYFFEHTLKKDILKLADAPDVHHPFPGYKTISFRPPGEAALLEQHIRQWSTEERHTSGAFAQTDYDFTRPKVSLKTKSSNPGDYAHSHFEVFDYPGEYVLKDDGEEWARARMEAFRATQTVANAYTDARGISAGYKFTITDAPKPQAQEEFLVISSIINLRCSSFQTGDNEGGGDVFSCSFTGIKASDQFRPDRYTPKPLINGVQTAIVTGESGKEIYTDEYGRVKVKFHWDREERNGEDRSCWIRVAQIWAGNRWGASFTPRVGQEVVVDFLEGDPDQPLIIGSVYNGIQPPPYLGLEPQPPHIGLGPDPKHKNDPNVSGIKTCSTLGGDGYNELRFDDTKGKEEIYIHSERNMDERVKNDSMETIGNNRSLTIGGEKDGQKNGDQMEEIYRDKHLKIHRNQEEQIGGSLKLHIGGIDGDGNLNLLIDANRIKTVGGDEHAHVKGDRKQKVNGDTSLTIGGKQQEKVGGNHALEAGQEIHLKAGVKMILEAGTQLTLKVGGNFVDISPAGVTIVGTMVLINSGGAAGSGSGSSPEAPKDAAAASPTKPEAADTSVTGNVSVSD